MEKIKKFFVTSVIGGVAVILPIVILIVVFRWLFNFVTNLIQPLTNILVVKSELRVVVANIIVLAAIIAACFFIGILVRTRFGGFLFRLIEEHLLKKAIGYNLVKETVIQLIGSQKSFFSAVALAQLFENDTMVTCFVTEEHEDGSFSVFVPTGPNPTSGNIYHLLPQFVHKVDVSIEDAMRSIISCGAGSSKLMQAYRRSSV